MSIVSFPDFYLYKQNLLNNSSSTDRVKIYAQIFQKFVHKMSLIDTSNLYGKTFWLNAFFLERPHPLQQDILNLFLGEESSYYIFRDFEFLRKMGTNKYLFKPLYLQILDESLKTHKDKLCRSRKILIKKVHRSVGFYLGKLDQIYKLSDSGSITSLSKQRQVELREEIVFYRQEFLYRIDVLFQQQMQELYAIFELEKRSVNILIIPFYFIAEDFFKSMARIQWSNIQYQGLAVRSILVNRANALFSNQLSKKFIQSISTPMFKDSVSVQHYRRFLATF